MRLKKEFRANIVREGTRGTRSLWVVFGVAFFRDKSCSHGFPIIFFLPLSLVGSLLYRPQCNNTVPPFDVTLFPARIATANRFTGQIEKKINDVGGNLLTKNHAGFAEFFPSWV